MSVNESFFVNLRQIITIIEKPKMKIVYCTPSLYIPGGVERVLTTKANYLADVAGYDIYIVLTDGKGKAPYYPLSSKIKVINLDINFEELWGLSFIKKGIVYLKKQRIFKKQLSQVLCNLKPDITVSLLRREINFLCDIKDGSRKVGEMHINRQNYRNFEAGDTNFIKRFFEKYWMHSLVRQLKRLDRFVVLSNEDKGNWQEIDHVTVIPNPLPPMEISQISTTESKRVIAVGRYVYQKGFDLLVEAWETVVGRHPDWHLYIYGRGDKNSYRQVSNCHYEEAVENINDKYAESSIFVLSSRFEGFGMVIIEAMSCGVPAVSFACPCGPKDIITDGKDGFLVENGNTQQLAERICYLIEHAEERKEMGEHAVETAKRYSINEIGKQWVSLFGSLATGRD